MVGWKGQDPRVLDSLDRELVPRSVELVDEDGMGRIAVRLRSGSDLDAAAHAVGRDQTQYVVMDSPGSTALKMSTNDLWKSAGPKRMRRMSDARFRASSAFANRFAVLRISSPPVSSPSKES